MKIFFNLKKPNNSTGGGYFFVQYLSDFFLEKGFKITYNLDTDIDFIFMIDPRKNLKIDKKYDIDTLLKYKMKNSKVKMVYPVNECDIKRKKSINIEPIILYSIEKSDIVVFISNWLKDYYINLAKKKNLCESTIKKIKNAKIINNCCDLKIFYPNKSKKLSTKKIKIVTHHWSNDYNKGFEIYNKLDKILDKFNNIEFTFVGRYIKDYVPKNIKIVNPKMTNDLSEELNKHDVYLTASLYEPGGLHQLEAMACGLPVLYRENSGGIKETIKQAGLEFIDINDMFYKLALIVDKYNDFRHNIDYDFLGINRCGKEYYDLINLNI